MPWWQPLSIHIAVIRNSVRLPVRLSLRSVRSFLALYHLKCCSVKRMFVQRAGPNMQETRVDGSRGSYKTLSNCLQIWGIVPKPLWRSNQVTRYTRLLKWQSASITFYQGPKWSAGRSGRPSGFSCCDWNLLCNYFEGIFSQALGTPNVNFLPGVSRIQSVWNGQLVPREIPLPCLTDSDGWQMGSFQRFKEHNWVKVVYPFNHILLLNGMEIFKPRPRGLTLNALHLLF